MFNFFIVENFKMVEVFWKKLRIVNVERKMKEIDILLILDLDGVGESVVNIGIGFLDYMLIVLLKYGWIDFIFSCKGDLYVDDYYFVEDCGIVFG